MLRGSTRQGAHYNLLPRCDRVASAATNLYRIHGVGGTMVASAQNLGEVDPSLSVFVSRPDTTLTCAGQYGNRRVTWEANKGQVFLLAISACCQPLFVDYALAIESRPSLNSCDSMYDLGMATDLVTFAGSSDMGAIGQNFTSCRSGDPYKGQAVIVHRIQGNGASLHASIYTQEFSREASISMFSGSCEAPECPKYSRPRCRHRHQGFAQTDHAIRRPPSLHRFEHAGEVQKFKKRSG